MPCGGGLPTMTKWSRPPTASPGTVALHRPPSPSSAYIRVPLSRCQGARLPLPQTSLDHAPLPFSTIAPNPRVIGDCTLLGKREPLALGFLGIRKPPTHGGDAFLVPCSQFCGGPWGAPAQAPTYSPPFPAPILRAALESPTWLEKIARVAAQCCVPWGLRIGRAVRGPLPSLVLGPGVPSLRVPRLCMRL